MNRWPCGCYIEHDTNALVQCSDHENRTCADCSQIVDDPKELDRGICADCWRGASEGMNGGESPAGAPWWEVA